MKKVLVFSFFPAFTPPSSGGELRLYNIYRELAQWYEVVLLSSTHLHGQEERVRHGNRFTERRLPKDNHFERVWQDLAPHGGAGDLSAICVGAAARFDSPMQRAYFEEYDQADIIVHTCPHTIDYDVFFGLDDKLRVYESYNDESALVRQLHETADSGRLHAMVADWERRLLEGAHLVTHCSWSDLQGFEHRVPGLGVKAISLPNGVAPLASLTVPAMASDRPSAVFVASAHLPNVTAARFIVEQLAPSLPEIDFDIAGACLPGGAYPPNVRRHGPVSSEAKHKLLTQATMALNPMAGGSGSNLKLLEYFSHGAAVVSTPFGGRGYEVEDGTHCVLVELDGFVAAMRQLLRDEPKRRAMGLRARTFAEERYSWPAIAQHLHKHLQSLQARAPGLLNQSFVLGMNDYDPFGSQGGGGVRIQGLFAAVDAEQPVVYLCLGGDRIEIEFFGAQSLVLKVPKTVAHRAAEDHANSEFWISVNDILATEQVLQNPMFMSMYSLLRKAASVIVIDHPYLVSVPTSYGDAFVYSSHNYETALKRQALEYHPRRDQWLAAVERAESIAIESAICVVTVSEQDAVEMLRGRSIGAPTCIVRNGASPPAAVLPTDAELARVNVGEHDLVFIGSPHGPNVESVKYIVEQLAPALPDVRIHIVGGCASAELAAPANVLAWGPVSDSLKSAILSACGIALNPMFSGGGSNIKIADYLGHGLAVMSTPFGRRGYPPEVEAMLTIADAAEFPSAIERLLADCKQRSSEQRDARRHLFVQQLSMRSLGKRFADLLQQLQRPRQKILFVTYRWVWPVRGGGEAHLLEHLRALSTGGRHAIDVIAPDVAEIGDHERFGGVFGSAGGDSAPVDLPHVRFMRFPVGSPPRLEAMASRRDLWAVQPRFEQALWTRLAPTCEMQSNALIWGWHWPQPDGRWAAGAFGVRLNRAGRLTLNGQVPRSAGLWIRDAAGRELWQGQVTGTVNLEIDLPAGDLEFELESGTIGDDQRQLGVFVESLHIDGVPLDLQANTLIERLGNAPASRTFEWMHESAQLARVGNAQSLALQRGPHAPMLEEFLDRHSVDYDLVITHNAVFRTALQAITSARTAGTPVLVFPLAHLDDDYYHFPSDVNTIARADLVAAAPLAACDFYRRRGARRVVHMTPGCDTREAFTASDVSAFRALWPDTTPFVLVLGRKAAAKGYSQVIDAVEEVARQTPVKVVMIGPDSDGLPVNTAHVKYLGAQPREVVRGALRSCMALVNMSSSESFGMVLLEAWLAERPVVANRGCAAFQDLAVHGHNALLVDRSGLARAIETLIFRPEFGRSLAAAGRNTATRYDWQEVNRRFVEMCDELIAGRAIS